MNIKQLLNIISVQSGIPAGLRMLKLKFKKKKNDRIKIVFLCQLGQLWSVFESIYDAAVADPMIEPLIVAVPEKWDEKPENIDTNALDYLNELGLPCINAYDYKKQEYLDLKSLGADYVFLPRPYDSYLPPAYRSMNIAKYAKTCYICYGYCSEGAHILKTCFSKYFTGNCYMIFAENDSVKSYCHGQLPISSRIGLHKIIKTPFSRFDLMNKYKDVPCSGWKRDKADVKHQIIWTPRWTLDEKLGGTNFFNFKDFFFEFAAENSDVDLLIRPHPMAFDNFVAVGAMTTEEVNAYKQQILASDNIALDENKEYLNNFASADILVSDMSGVVVDFAVTGKPVVFCSYKQEFNKASRKLLDAYYIVHDKEELKATLDMLCRGEDPKKELRKSIVTKLLGRNDGQNGKRIIELIKQDY